MADSAARAKRIGYTVIGGFLGAGKTTMINGMLATATERLALIVNDLGEVNVDASLIRAMRTGDGRTPDTIELTNGCVCCSIGDSLAATLRALCLGETSAVPPEHIVLECSGAADPASAAAYGSRRVLAEPSIVVAADATDIRQRASDPRFAALVSAQLASADLIAVTKSDLIDSVDSVVEWLSENTSAPLVVGNPGPLGAVLPRADRSELISTSRLSALSVETHRLDDLVTRTDIETLLASVGGLVRAKGIVEFADGQQLVQWGAGRLNIEPWADSRGNGPNDAGEIVTISS